MKVKTAITVLIFLTIYSAVALPQDRFGEERASRNLLRADGNSFDSASIIAAPPFIENAGQIKNESVKFYLSSAGRTIYFTDDSIVMDLYRITEKKFTAVDGREETREGKEGVVLRISFVEGRPLTVRGENPLPGKVHYFVGDKSSWRSNIPTYSEVLFEEIYEGIDLRYISAPGKLKYQFEVKAGGDPEDIKVRLEGVDGIIASPAGNLVLRTAKGDFEDERPFVYQEIGGQKVEISSGFRLIDATTYGFSIGRYDSRLPLIVDPALRYSTFLGGALDDTGDAIVVDDAGHAYVTGNTLSYNFPTHPTPGAYDPSFNGNFDIFVSKFLPDGSGLVYSTYIGGADRDYGSSIDVDEWGYVYVTGETFSDELLEGFPVTPTAYDPEYNNGDPDNHSSDAFILELYPGGGLSYCTYLGGTFNDGANAIVVKSVFYLVHYAYVYVTGYTLSDDFPTTPLAFDRQRNDGDPAYADKSDAFVTHLYVNGSSLEFSTFLGGKLSERGYALDLYHDPVHDLDFPVVAGKTASDDFVPSAGTVFNLQPLFPNVHYDVFVAQLGADGTTLPYAAIVGGTRNDSGVGLRIDSVTGEAVVAGSTTSADFPTTTGAYDPSYNDRYAGWDAFAIKISASGDYRVYSTYLGGSERDNAKAVALNAAGEAYLTGYTESVDYPATFGCFNRINNGGADAFVSQLNSMGDRLLYSTFLGGGRADWANGIAIDAAGDVYLTGETQGLNDPACQRPFPITAGAFDEDHNGAADAFVTKLGLTESLYSTFLGGTDNDRVHGLAADETGCAYVTGQTWSDAMLEDFPIIGPYSLQGPSDVFVTKFNEDGTAHLYSTYVGGESDDGGYAIAVDDDGCAYVTGFTISKTFPAWIDPNAMDKTYGGGTDAFLIKLDAGGSYAVSTYIGGPATDYGNSIHIDSATGIVSILGDTETFETDWPFPIPTPTYQDRLGGNRDAFLIALDAGPSPPLYFSYIGGSGWDRGLDFVVDVSNRTYVTGLTNTMHDFHRTGVLGYDQTFNGWEDAFVIKLDDAGVTALYSTYLGGSNLDRGLSIEVDCDGHAYVAGYTDSTDSPTTSGAFQESTSNTTDDAFIVKLRPDGRDLVYSTYLGHDGNDYGYSLAVDRHGYAYLTGATESPGFPSSEPYHGGQDAFLSVLKPSGAELEFSWLFGGTALDAGHCIFLHEDGHLYLAGSTQSADFPVTPGVVGPAYKGGTDIFVGKL